MKKNYLNLFYNSKQSILLNNKSNYSNIFTSYCGLKPVYYKHQIRQFSFEQTKEKPKRHFMLQYKYCEDAYYKTGK